MHEFRTILIVSMTYTRLQNYTNMGIGEHGIQTLQVVLVVLLFDVFVPTSVHPLFFWNKLFV